jgi:UDP-N-acetylmuramyl pentapeptide synthase
MNDRTAQARVLRVGSLLTDAWLWAILVRMAITLSELMACVPGARLRGRADVPIAAITADSRQAGPGSLFVAYRGLAADGHDHIGQAVARGAAAVVAEGDR